MRVLSRYRFAKHDLKAAEQFWATLELECSICGYHWIAVYPVAGYHMNIHCPECDSPAGVTHEGVFE